jgi:hypothetical protein
MGLETVLMRNKEMMIKVEQINGKDVIIREINDIRRVETLKMTQW